MRISSSVKEREKKEKKLSENNYWNLQKRKSRMRWGGKPQTCVCFGTLVYEVHIPGNMSFICVLWILFALEDTLEGKKPKPTEAQVIMQFFWFSEINS